MRVDDVLENDADGADRDGETLQAGRSSGSPDPSTTTPASGVKEKMVAVASKAATMARSPIRVQVPLLEKLAARSPGWTGANWAELPTPNRVFALSGAFCLALASLRMVVSAASEAVEATSSVLHPYTAAGRSETCLANLASLHQALAMYTADNDGLYPPLDYTRPVPGTKDGERVTWVSLVRPKTGTKALQCPAGSGVGPAGVVSSYALNPVLSLGGSNNVDNPAETLLLADAGAQHDVSLLPPYPSWPSFAKRDTPPTADEGPGTLANLAARHDGKAGALYVDGHAGLTPPGELEMAAATWGGSAVFRRSLDRLTGQSASASALVALLKTDEIGLAASVLRSHGKELAPVKEGLAALWVLNKGDVASESVTKAGWNLSRAAKAVGDTSIAKRLNDEESQRCQEELARTEVGAWETKAASWGASFPMPTAWTLEEEVEGRYQRAYLRSALAKELYVLHETGENRSYVTPRPIDWHGMEKDLRKRYHGDRYKRIAMKRGELNGQVANVWEFELDKLGGPRLRKRFVGYSDGWNSHVVTWVAPARDFVDWRPVF